MSQPVRHKAVADVQLVGQFPWREAVDGGVAEIPKPQLDVLAEFVVRDLLRVVPAEGLQSLLRDPPCRSPEVPLLPPPTYLLRSHVEPALIPPVAPPRRTVV